jgi:hypothetical protein
MTVYARSDIAAVSISTAHGGCGEVHSRPAPGGKPVAEWALTCGPCENHLRHDPLWATFTDQIPETPDEIRSREEAEKRGQRDQAVATQAALTNIADMPAAFQALAEALLKQGGNITLPTEPSVPTVACANGHQVKHDAKFCHECGLSMSLAAPITMSLDIKSPSAELAEAGKAAVEGIQQGLSAAAKKAPARRVARQ